MSFYVKSALSTLPKLLGSLDLLGGPAERLREIGVGLRQVTLDPLQAEIAAMLNGSEPGAGWPLMRQGALELLQRLVYVPFTMVYTMASALSSVSALLTLDPGYIHRHPNKVYAHGNAINISRGTWTGVKAAFFGLQDALTAMLSNPYVGWRQGRRRDALLEVPRSLWGAPFKLLSGGFDLVAKASEGIKNSASLQTHRVGRQRPPLAIHTDRLIRQYVPDESAAYALLSLCAPDVLHSQGRRAEAFEKHLVIDYRPSIPGAPMRTMALVVTSRRVVFGSVDPPRVKFEVPRDRMAR